MLALGLFELCRLNHVAGALYAEAPRSLMRIVVEAAQDLNRAKVTMGAVTCVRSVRRSRLSLGRSRQQSLSAGEALRDVAQLYERRVSHGLMSMSGVDCIDDEVVLVSGREKPSAAPTAP
jgi:hypothetical protein